MSNFNYKKKYGQNFLRDDSIAEAIVNSIAPTSDDLIIEIGPGDGAITKKLKKYNTSILAFEIDPETKNFLQHLEDSKTHVIYEDFLTADINNYLKNYNFKNLYIIGNLPYYITTPIIERIIDLNINIHSLVIMVQKEVADRFLAVPRTRNYGYFTVILNYHFNISRIVEVSKNKFYPVPKVESTVLKLTKKNSVNVNYEKFKTLVKNSFQFKRKTINNNLSHVDKVTLQDVLLKYGFDLNSRAEDLPLEVYIELTEKL